MRIAVVGAGIVGVTTAHELAADGHEVAVFERRGSVAAEASFANAGVVAPGYVTPWAWPGMPGKVLSYLLAAHAPVRLNARLDAGTLAWLWKWWRACNSKRYQANRTRMQRLAVFSRDRLHQLTRDLQLEYERNDGYLVLLRSARDVAAARPGLALLAELGFAFESLDAAGCRRVEPGLNAETPLAAGIHLARDEVANCRQFALLLRGQARQLGARFVFDTTVLGLHPGAKPGLTHQYLPPAEAPPPSSVYAESRLHEEPATTPPTGPVTETFDAVVLCAALGAPALLAPHGLRLPLLAVHGYSVTAPLRHIEEYPDLGPRSAVMDERFKVAISRLGNRVRVAGSAEIGGSLARFNPGAISTLYKVLSDWFPGAARLSQAQRWKGARPMLPDGPPVLGASGIPGIWLNLGHGSSGWALACGSARILTDGLAGREAAIDIEGLGVSRLVRAKA